MKHKPCPKCNGTGYREIKATISFKDWDSKFPKPVLLEEGNKIACDCFEGQKRLALRFYHLQKIIKEVQ